MHQQLQRSLVNLQFCKRYKTSKSELIARHWLRNNTYNIIFFVTTALFLSSLFGWSGRNETFILRLWWYTTFYMYFVWMCSILTLTIIFFSSFVFFFFYFSSSHEKTFRVQVCDRCDAKRLLYNFIMKCFEFSNWLCMLLEVCGALNSNNGQRAAAGFVQVNKKIEIRKM